MVKIETEVAVKVFGYKKTGKSHVLKMIKDLFESKGFVTNFNARLDDETLFIKYLWNDSRFPEIKEGVDVDGVE